VIVYGDPGEWAEASSTLADLQASAQRTTANPSLESLRSLLIRIGQLEQALADGGGPPTLAATDAAANAFLQSWSGEPPNLQATTAALQTVYVESGQRILLKVPEGFAFYGLYPEQYVEAARTWLRAISPPAGSRVLVVGLRSIGTTLSAVVTAELRRAGMEVRRVTVRPEGHPYDRKVRMDCVLATATWGLVVDEGPGRSGSSLFAASEALRVEGIPAERQAVLAAHGQLGSEASGDVRVWWDRVRRLAASDQRPTWGGRSVHELLQHRAAERMGWRPGDVQMIDLGGGAWRDILGMPWAPAWPAFERAKVLCVGPGGMETGGWLWKFAGLGAEGTLGYRGREWVPGRALSVADLDDATVGEMAEYLCNRAVERLSDDEADASLGRLRGMAHWNIREPLGDGWGDSFARWTDFLSGKLLQERRQAPDGRMGPWEWIRAADGGVVKVDAEGHSVDHTRVGRQSLWWDVAGAAVEWEMTESARTRWTDAIGLRDPEVLNWFCVAYAAFRVGMSAMGGVDSARYRRVLEETLR
jgi:hypothetical protein